MSEPRIILQRSKLYRRVPDEFQDRDGNAPLYKAFSRFPVKNQHWLYELISYDGNDYLLESIQENAFDKEGRATHYFRETKDEIVETSIVYIKAADGATVEIAASSNGRVTIGTLNFDGQPSEDPYCYWINDGHRHELEMSKMTDMQQRCMELQDRYIWGDGEHHFTEEEEAEAKEIIDSQSHMDVLTRDEHGNPLVELSWDCDKIIYYEVNEYIYAEN